MLRETQRYSHRRTGTSRVNIRCHFKIIATKHFLTDFISIYEQEQHIKNPLKPNTRIDVISKMVHKKDAKILN